MAGLADTIADNAVYVVLAVVLFALFFLALNGAMPDDASGPDDGTDATTMDGGGGTDGNATDDGSVDDGGNASEIDGGEDGDGNVSEDGGGGIANASSDGTEENETGSLDVDRIEALLIEGVDTERNASNVSNVSWIRSGALREMAAYHTDDMITHGYVAVESPGGEGLDDRRESFQPDCSGRALGELVGRAETVTDAGVRRNASTIASTLVQGWLDGRSDTLLRNDTALGAVAAGLDAEGSRVYVTMDLC